MKSVRVLVPGIKLKDGKTDAKVFGVYLSNELAMSRFTLNKRIAQKPPWLEVMEEAPPEEEPDNGGDPPEEEPRKLWIGFTDCDHEEVYFEGEPTPVSCTQCAAAEKAEEEDESDPELDFNNPKLLDNEDFIRLEEEPVIESGPNTGEVDLPDEDLLNDGSEEMPIEESSQSSQVHPEPTRDEKTINEYWDAATIPADKTRARACGFCETEHNSKTGLFECCEDKSAWGERK